MLKTVHLACCGSYSSKHAKGCREAEIERLREVVERQDQAIDVGIAALGLHAKRNGLSRESREAALNVLVLARNERIRT